MTDDLGPGRTEPADLDAVFRPYLSAAAGRAADVGDEAVAELLRDAEDVRVAFSEPPVTSVGGAAQAAVEVTVVMPAGHLVDASTLDRLAALLTDVASADGYQVRRCEIRAG